MKTKLFLWTFAGLLLAQCTRPDPVEIPLPSASVETTVVSFAVTPDEAAAEALEAREALAPATRSQAVAVSSVARHAASAAASDPAQVDPSLYVVNFADQGGFAIVAADRRQHATVYAVSDRGAFPDPATLEEGTLKFLFRRIETLAAATPPAIKPHYVTIPGVWKDDDRVDGLVKVRWGIGEPYNQTRQITAFCQIMSYHKYPQSFDWDLMLGNDRVYIGLVDPQDAEIGRLFANVAAKYKSGELKNWIGAFGYTCALSEPYYYEKVFLEIDRGKRPVYATASANYGYIPQSYSWVMDGYLSQHRVITYASSRPGEMYPSDRTEYRTLIHCNLGNDGIGNGFYLSTLFDLHTGADVPDTGAAPPTGYVDGQIEYAPSDIRITTNIKKAYSEYKKDTALIAKPLWP